MESVATVVTRCKASALPPRLGSLRLPHFLQPRRRIYLRIINQGVGPIYSIRVGPFYVVKATGYAQRPGNTGWTVFVPRMGQHLRVSLLIGSLESNELKQGAMSPSFP